MSDPLRKALAELKEVIAWRGKDGRGHASIVIERHHAKAIVTALTPSHEAGTQYDPAFVKSILDADAAPPEATISTIEELTAPEAGTWTEQELREAKSEAANLHSYFHPWAPTQEPVADNEPKLPCDFFVGSVRFHKGVKIETVRLAAERWYKAAVEQFAAPASQDATREALDLLQLQQRGRARAFRILDSKREVSDPTTLAIADAYEECGNELQAILASRADRAVTAEVSEWMIRHGYVTGHGDTLDDLLGELVHQVHANALLEAHKATVSADKRACGNSMEEAAADNFGLTVDDLDEDDDECAVTPPNCEESK